MADVFEDFKKGMSRIIERQTAERNVTNIIRSELNKCTCFSEYGDCMHLFREDGGAIKCAKHGYDTPRYQCEDFITANHLKSMGEECAARIMERVEQARSKANAGDLSVYDGFLGQLKEKLNS